MKLFNVVDNKFFSILAAPNKELYLDCLLEIYQRVDELETTAENTKDKIIENVKYLLESRDSESIFEEDAGDLPDAHSKARYIVNHIRDCGWLFEEDLGHNVVLININAKALKMIKLIQEICSDTLEYTGFVSSIYLLAREITKSKEISQIEQMHKQTDELIVSLKSLKSTIFTYYNALIKKAKFSNAQQIIEELLSGYKENFFDKAYLKLKTYDNLAKYKDFIQKKIREIMQDEALWEELIFNRQDEKYNTPAEAERWLHDKLDNVYNSFNTIDRLIKAIDDKNRKYINAAISKAMFFINRSDDFEGMYNRLAELINEDKIEYGTDYEFRLFESKNIDRTSLYTPRESVRTKEDLDKVQSLHLDETFEDEKMKELFQSAEFSFDEISKYAGGLLAERIRIRASEIPCPNSRDFVKTILLYLYSKSLDCNYNLEVLSEKVTVNGVTFNDFILERRSAR